MTSNQELGLRAEDIEKFELPEAEEKLIYLRYLLRREHQEYMLMKYQYFIECLEKRIAELKANPADPAVS